LAAEDAWLVVVDAAEAFEALKANF